MPSSNANYPFLTKGDDESSPRAPFRSHLLLAIFGAAINLYRAASRDRSIFSRIA